MGVESRGGPRGRHFFFQKFFDIPWKICTILSFPEKTFQLSSAKISDDPFPLYFPCFTAILGKLCPDNQKFFRFCPPYYYFFIFLHNWQFKHKMSKPGPGSVTEPRGSVPP